VKLPGSFAEEPDKAGGAWLVAEGLSGLLRVEDFEGLEHVFAAGTADLKPWSLARSMRLSTGHRGVGDTRRSWDLGAWVFTRLARLSATIEGQAKVWR
jgi:hypothetical protein